MDGEIVRKICLTAYSYQINCNCMGRMRIGDAEYFHGSALAKRSLWTNRKQKRSNELIDKQVNVFGERRNRDGGCFQVDDRPQKQWKLCYRIAARASTLIWDCDGVAASHIVTCIIRSFTIFDANVIWMKFWAAFRGVWSVFAFRFSPNRLATSLPLFTKRFARDIVQTRMRMNRA